MAGDNGGSGRGEDRSFRSGDPRIIDCETPSERAYWCKALMVSESELAAAMGAVGNSAQGVKDWLEAMRLQVK